MIPQVTPIFGMVRAPWEQEECHRRNRDTAPVLQRLIHLHRRSCHNHLSVPRRHSLHHRMPLPRIMTATKTRLRRRTHRRLLVSILRRRVTHLRRRATRPPPLRFHQHLRDTHRHRRRSRRHRHAIVLNHHPSAPLHRGTLPRAQHSVLHHRDIHPHLLCNTLPRRRSILQLPQNTHRLLRRTHRPLQPIPPHLRRTALHHPSGLLPVHRKSRMEQQGVTLTAHHHHGIECRAHHFPIVLLRHSTCRLMTTGIAMSCAAWIGYG